MHFVNKEGLKDSDTDFTGENRWQKNLESYQIHTAF